MSSAVSIVVMADGDPNAVLSALESARRQAEPDRITLAGPLEDPTLKELLAPHTADYQPLVLANIAPSELRNRAVAEAPGPLVVVVESHERLGEEALTRHVSALANDTSLVGSYGRTAIHEHEKVRVRPENGKGGEVYRRLLKERYLISSSACLVWRKAALTEPAYGDYTTPAALRMDLTLRLSRLGDFVFHPSVVAERLGEPTEMPDLEEMVRVFVGIVFGPESLDERVEQRARFRLARHLVAIGKHHYRSEDYRRAGKFFDEAVKAAPSYFRGRRYQFLNFVKNTLSRTN